MMIEIGAAMMGTAVLAAAWGLRASNRLVALDERCDCAQGDLDALLKHRHSLIPPLVETVKAAARHERDVLGEVVRARRDALAAAGEARVEAESALSQSLVQLLASAETYPDLVAMGHYRELRNRLTEVEERIVTARRFHNLTVDEYNATLRQFPGSVVAELRSMTRRKPFDLGFERVLLDEPVRLGL